MTSPEIQEQPASLLCGATAVVNELERLDQTEYAEAIQAVENLGMSRHPIAYGADLEVARKLLRPQLPQAARQHFVVGYEALLAEHEASLTDYVGRTNDFLVAHPGILQYDASAHADEERRWHAIVRVEKVSSDVQGVISWVRVVNDNEQSVQLAPHTLHCDITKFESELSQTLAGKLRLKP
ncbi:MAG TPA: hypothetical protein VGE30_01065 [Candidatus Saccharimonadales bacterium]